MTGGNRHSYASAYSLGRYVLPVGPATNARSPQITFQAVEEIIVVCEEHRETLPCERFAMHSELVYSHPSVPGVSCIVGRGGARYGAGVDPPD